MSDTALEALWKNVLNHWEDEKAHGAFLEQCQRAGMLVEAAVRYRGMAGDRKRGPSAQKRLNSVALLAMAELEQHRTTEHQARSRAGSLVLIIFFVAATIGLGFYLYVTP
jgi:hypothetical protein